MVEHRDADLRGSRFDNVDLSESRVRSAFLRDVVVTDAWVEDVRIEGNLMSLSVNGIDVAPYVYAELDRRHPERQGLRPSDVESLRQSWTDAMARSAETVERARRMPAEMLDEQVDGEFSFIQTLRHLVFAYDRWLTGPVFNDPEPYFHPIGETHASALEGPAQGLDPDARPTLDEVLAVRDERSQRLMAFLDDAGDDDLGRTVASPNGGETTMIDCARVVLDEEWWHRQYAARDLAVLEQRLGPKASI